MKEIKDLTVEDLIAEGRPWVVMPGERTAVGTRVLVVFKDHPYRYPIGQISNDPNLMPPLIVVDDDPEASCIQLSIEQGNVKDKMEYLQIVMSSMGARHKAMRVRVLLNYPDSFTLSNGYGDTMTMDEENATTLYEGLAEALGLPHQIHCRDCGDPMMDYDECSCLDEAESV